MSDLPTTEPDAELLAALRLMLVNGIGPRTWQALLDAFGTPAEVFAATTGQLQQVNGVGPKLAAGIRLSDPATALDEWTACQRDGVKLFVRGRDDYPAALGRITDPPPVLYCRGTLTKADELAVAIVGSRHCTAYGRQTAEKLAGALARAGITVVSGLARGIDACAHQGALNAGGRTLAVFATGLQTIYPPEHRELAEEVAANGALLTESPLRQQPLPGLFPQRNRIIAGLSLGVIVIEAGRASGALHTARHAMEQNREVFAVPGRIDSEHSLGCLDLIRDGATLIRDVQDVLNALGPLTTPVPKAAAPEENIHHPAELLLSDQERAILHCVLSDTLSVDEVVRAAGLETSRVLTTLTVLEMRQLVRRLPGGFVARR
jgi:DNA processing protein